MTAKKIGTRVVRWYTCDCEWVGKYCDEFHTARSRLPLAVLQACELPKRDDLDFS